MVENMVTIQGKNGEIRQGQLEWIENAEGEFWFYDELTAPHRMWGKLDYWKIVGYGVAVFYLAVFHLKAERGQ